MQVSEVPDYVLRNIVKSRTNKPAEFAGATQLVRRDTPDKDGNRKVVATFTAIVQHDILALHRGNVTSTEAVPSPRSWTLTKHDNPKEALHAMKDNLEKMFERGYEPIVDGLYMVPVNTTDVKHAIRTKELPHWILSLVYQNYMNIRQHISALENASADPTLPPVPPGPTAASAAPFTSTSASGPALKVPDADVDALTAIIRAEHGRKMGI